jgi:glycosyltransferase involved in cell wall biosynthesis
MSKQTPLVPTIAVGLFSYQFGGSERVGVDLALEFKQRGYRVLCFAFHDSDGPLKNDLKAADIRCLDLNYGKHRGIFRRPVYLWKMWKMLRHESVHALHVHHHGSLILCGIPAWVAGTRRVVMTEHGLQALEERADARRLTKRYARYATSITVVEPKQATYFKSVLGIAADKVHCVANGVRVPKKAPEDIQLARKLLGIASTTFAFFYVGRLEFVKDLGTLLRAFAALPSEIRSRAKLYLVGDGSERGLLESQCRALGIEDRVIFMGARSDAARLLIAADAFVMSSKSEGLPMALLEAMAAGIPCVATAVGGIPNLFSEERGVPVPAGDASQLSKAMGAVATSHELRVTLARNAMRGLHLHYAFTPIVDRYLELLGLAARAVPASIS